MIYIHNANRWHSAKLLAHAIRKVERAALVVTVQNVDRIQQQDNLIVNWGCRGRFGLNRAPVANKLIELEMLDANKVRVPPFATTIQELRDNGIVGDVLARTFHHFGGADFMPPQPQANFYTKKLSLVHEFRIHVFRDRSVRAGLKVPRPGVIPHPWLRSFHAGWNIEYSTRCQELLEALKVRRAAKRAVAALEYDFGAVDVGVTADNKVWVLEVNMAPGLKNENTALAYARHVVAVAAGK